MKHFIILLSLIGLLNSCSYSKLIDMPLTKSIDTAAYVPVKQDVENIDSITLSALPIDFEVAVDDWEDY